jgi:ABC-2 type transport system ATP-binding protein
MEGSPLRVEGFGRRYRRTRPWAVREASFTVPDGSITALVGANGAGKSTLIRACVGFERPDEGRILVYGLDPSHDRTQVVNSIGYVPQSAALYQSLTIADHLDMGTAARRSFDRPYALSRVSGAGLTERRRISELSGGEQAQVALSLALGTRAPLLLLDEPLASLDPLARRDFLTALVNDVRGRGATAVLSSHIVTDVEDACDWLVVLAAGRLVLHTAIAAGKTEYVTVSATDLGAQPAIGTFAGPGGALLALVHGSPMGRPASLEEIVLGHLAAARTRRPEEAA